VLQPDGSAADQYLIFNVANIAQQRVDLCLKNVVNNLAARVDIWKKFA
jgi:hypothetical protein